MTHSLDSCLHLLLACYAVLGRCEYRSRKQAQPLVLTLAQQKSGQTCPQALLRGQFVSVTGQHCCCAYCLGLACLCQLRCQHLNDLGTCVALHEPDHLEHMLAYVMQPTLSRALALGCNLASICCLIPKSHVTHASDITSEAIRSSKKLVVCFGRYHCNHEHTLCL